MEQNGKWELFSACSSRGIHTESQWQRTLAWDNHDVRPGSLGGDQGGTGNRTGTALSPEFIRIPTGQECTSGFGSLCEELLGTMVRCGCRYKKTLFLGREIQRKN
ncbi:MAG: hypothetical protein A2X05_03720 [Bacteroidetes bacterium GWE2_41_25]|nr:MAG: hypothetical protein A2X05_03720 [Bacteroidetes bacterium GWE2_41_25]